MLHSLVAGGLRIPRWHSSSLHTPLRPFGTHAYVVSASGARKLLRHCSRAAQTPHMAHSHTAHLPLGALLT